MDSRLSVRHCGAGKKPSMRAPTLLANYRRAIFGAPPRQTGISRSRAFLTDQKDGTAQIDGSSGLDPHSIAPRKSVCRTSSMRFHSNGA
jgi:hypothetical protein